MTVRVGINGFGRRRWCVDRRARGAGSADLPWKDLGAGIVVESTGFFTDTVGESATSTVAALADGDVALLEIVRCNADETSKDDTERWAFADQLTALADALVSDAFSVVHREQASVYGAAQRLPDAMAGWSPPRSTCCVGSPSTPRAPTWWCSMGRRSPTSSASSATSWRGRQAPDRRRDGLHVLGRAGP